MNRANASDKSRSPLKDLSNVAAPPAASNPTAALKRGGKPALNVSDDSKIRKKSNPSVAVKTQTRIPQRSRQKPRPTGRPTNSANTKANTTSSSAKSDDVPSRYNAKPQTSFQPSNQRVLSHHDRRQTSASTITVIPSTTSAPAPPALSRQQTEQTLVKIAENMLNPTLAQLAEGVKNLPQQSHHVALVQKAATLEAEKKALEHRLVDYQAQLDLSKKSAHFATNENTRLVSENDSLKQQLSSAHNGEGSLNEKLSDLHTALAARDIKIKQAAAVNLASEQSIAKLESSVRDLKNQVAELDVAVTSAEAQGKASSTRATEAISKLVDVEATLAARDSDLRRLERERDGLSHERDELHLELQARDAKLRASADEVRNLRTTLDTHREESARREADAEMRLNEVRREFESKVRLVENERDETMADRDSISRDVEALRAQVASLTTAVGSLEGEKSQANADIMTQKALYGAMESARSSLQTENTELKKTLEQRACEVSDLQKQAREDAKVRRRLHNQVQELKGNIRVFCRVRPPPSDVAESTAEPLFEYTENGQGVVARQFNQDGRATVVHKFSFDKVFDAGVRQAEVFEEISELVQSALDGYRVCIFAYGQTGSGKTHTMLGRRSADGGDLGMIPRAIQQIFSSAKEMEKDGWTYQLSASFVEIYNETLRDLLVDSPAKAKDMRITFNNETRTSSVSNVTVVEVQEEEQVHKLIGQSMRNRATAATKVNEHSSRSHSVFRLRIEGQNRDTNQKLDGRLNLIDLAGSERLEKSKAEGARLQETKNINKSLSALGDIMNALANKDRHIPYRNSKLTHMLQDSMGGDSKTLMFVNVAQVADSMNESVCSLRFAAKVNNVHVGTAKRSARVE